MPKISVIVPVYNAEKFLFRCIDSILNQTFKDFELLLIDDGSTDRSGDICDEYAKKDLRISVFHKRNGGVSTARNVGLDNARGEWICFIDSDDYISSNYFSAVEKNDADIILFQNKRIHLDGSVYVTYALPPCKSRDFSEYRAIIKPNLVYPIVKVPWAKIIRKEKIGDLRFKIGQTIGEDALFIYELLNKCQSIAICNDYTYYWQDADNGGDAVKYQQKPKMAAEYVSNIYQAYKKLNMPSVEVESLFLNYFFMLCQCGQQDRYKDWFANKDVISMTEFVKANNPSLLSCDYLFYSRPLVVQYYLQVRLMLGKIVRRINRG